MIGSIWLHNLPDALEGLNVTLYKGWENRSRSSGGYNALMGIVVHHTASSTSTTNDCNYLWNSTGGDQPIGALYLARDGEIVVGAAGATNCAGKGGPFATSKGTIPLDSANSNTISIEAANNGVGEPWPQVQQDAYVALVAALCNYYDLDPLRDAMSHAEWAPTRKIDPAGESRWAKGSATWNMDLFRADVDELTGGGQLPIPSEPTPEEDERMLGLVRLDTNPNAVYVMDGVQSRKVRSDEMDELTSNLQYDTGFRYYDLTVTGRPQIRDINKIPKRSDDQLQLWGIETTESTTQP